MKAYPGFIKLILSGLLTTSFIPPFFDPKINFKQKMLEKWRSSSSRQRWRLYKACRL